MKKVQRKKNLNSVDWAKNKANKKFAVRKAQQLQCTLQLHMQCTTMHIAYVVQRQYATKAKVRETIKQRAYSETESAVVHIKIIIIKKKVPEQFTAASRFRCQHWYITDS